MSIDILPKEHRELKIFSALNGETIREFVVKSIHERLRQEKDSQELVLLASQISPALSELWKNDKDAAYDAL
ncbi:MAG: hypothetical protein JW774_04185 [Candidatus Aureabacteria bacterium]|nr:hypothetical protein [Candidatus Auribacterota bacterium]